MTRSPAEGAPGGEPAPASSVRPRWWWVIAAGSALVAVVAEIAALRAGTSGSGARWPSGDAAPIATVAGATHAPLLVTAYRGEERLGGGRIDLASLLGRGKPVVLNFWAGLCPPCRAEMPSFQRVHEE